MSNQKLAEILHQATSECSNGTAKIIKKCQVAALNGKSFIEVKCSKMDYECLHDTWNNIPETPLVEDLKSHGFHLKADKNMSFLPFRDYNYTLQISW